MDDDTIRRCHGAEAEKPLMRFETGGGAVPRARRQRSLYRRGSKRARRGKFALGSHGNSAWTPMVARNSSRLRIVSASTIASTRSVIAIATRPSGAPHRPLRETAEVPGRGRGCRLRGRGASDPFRPRHGRPWSLSSAVLGMTRAEAMRVRLVATTATGEAVAVARARSASPPYAATTTAFIRVRQPAPVP